MIKMIFSDIHGNYDALTEVLKAGKGLRKICLGDVIGYGADSKECLKEIRRRNIKTIKGNHEEALTSDEQLECFNLYAYESVIYARRTLSTEDCDFIKQIPYSIIEKDVMYAHGTPYHPENFHYLDQYTIYTEKSFRDMVKNNIKICFVGHTHDPLILEGNVSTKKINRLNENTITLKDDCIYIINVGSVGQSRNGVPEAFYVLYDNKANTVKIKSVPYDIDKSANAIYSAGLPRKLGDRLYVAR